MKLLEVVQIQNPTTWVKYKTGLCADCWAGCCTLPLEVSVSDLIRLGLTTEDEAACSLNKLANRLKREGWIQSFRAKTQLFIIKQKSNGDCLFLDQSRKCTVYQKRPEVCRKFPKIGPRPGFCPKQKHSS